MCSNWSINSYHRSEDCIVIDIHCHILPEVDDGPKSWESAVEMCRMAASNGITHTVATPHANDRYAYDRSFLSGLLDELREKIDPALPLQLSLGCDFHLSFENLERALEQPHTYTIGETNYLLIELSNYSVPARLSECFTRLGDRGLTPILTHPERNPILQQTPQRIVEWAEQGCLIQVTGSALTGHWGERRNRSPAGCWIALPSTSWRRMLTTRSAVSRIFPRPARWRKDSWEPRTPRLWSRATRGQSSKGCQSLIARGPC